MATLNSAASAPEEKTNEAQRAKTSLAIIERFFLDPPKKEVYERVQLFALTRTVDGTGRRALVGLDSSNPSAGGRCGLRFSPMSRTHPKRDGRTDRPVPARKSPCLRPAREGGSLGQKRSCRRRLEKEPFARLSPGSRTPVDPSPTLWRTSQPIELDRNPVDTRRRNSGVDGDPPERCGGAETAARAQSRGRCRSANRR